MVVNRIAFAAEVDAIVVRFPVSLELHGGLGRVGPRAKAAVVLDGAGSCFKS